LLRPGWIEDAAELARAIGDEAIIRRLPEMPWPYALHHAEADVRRQQASPLPDLLMFARTEAAPRLVGGVSFAREINGAEMRFWIARRFWGLGFATEGCQAALAMVRQSLAIGRISARVAANHGAARNVLTKLGFVPTLGDGLFQLAAMPSIDEQALAA
jgi:RimJ/RimL family protein N-acetyltransferase